MRSNKGHKIQVLAKAVLVIGIIASIIAFISGTAKYLGDKDCLEYSSYLGDKVMDMIL
jgi:hypothetical protein